MRHPQRHIYVYRKGTFASPANVVLADAPANNSAARKYEKYEQQKQIDGSTNLAAIANRRSSLIEDVTSNYTTEINGGLILSTLMQMRGLENDGSLKTNAGISGLTNEVNPVRFWAGSTFENRNSAPFRVRHDGGVVMTNAAIEGDIIAGTDDRWIEILNSDGVIRMYAKERGIALKVVEINRKITHWGGAIGGKNYYSGIIELLHNDSWLFPEQEIKTIVDRGLQVVAEGELVFRRICIWQTTF